MPTDASAIPAQSDVYCPACGYNLRGLTVVNRCPECGGAVDLSAPPVARVPWAHWRQLGRVRAFAETVWVATFAPGQVLHDAALPNRYRDGRVFRFTAVLLATLAASVGLWQVREAFADFRLYDSAAGPLGGARPPGRVADLLLPLDAGLEALWPATPVAIFLALWSATAVGQWFLRPRSTPLPRQNRASAVSQYACGPLAWVPVWAAMGWFVVVVVSRPRHDVWALRLEQSGLLPLIVLLAAAGVVAGTLVWWVTIVRLAYRVSEGSVARAAAAAVLWPLAWAVLVAFVTFGVVWGVGFLRLVSGSFRG